MVVEAANGVNLTSAEGRAGDHVLEHGFSRLDLVEDVAGSLDGFESDEAVATANGGVVRGHG